MSDVSMISSAMLADGVQPRPLVADALADRPIRRQRMRPPRLAEAPHERRVARLEEDQHRVEPRHLPQPPEDRRELRQEAALAHVDDDRDLVDVAAGAQRQLRQRRNERRRQVVDAEVAEVLERADRLRLAGPGQPGQHDERLPGLRRRASLSARRRRAGRARAPGASSRVTRGLRRRLRRRSGDRRRRVAQRLARAGRRARAPRDGRAPQQLVARRHLDEDRDVAARRDRHADERHAQPEDLEELVVEAEALVLARRDPSVRAARRARRASTTASRRCRTGP